MSTELFYIQHRGFSGDCLLWWRKERAGYTMDLDDALQVPMAEAESICRSRPTEDIKWQVSLIDRLARRHVNNEDLQAHLRESRRRL